MAAQLQLKQVKEDNFSLWNLHHLIALALIINKAAA